MMIFLLLKICTVASGDELLETNANGILTLRLEKGVSTQEYWPVHMTNKEKGEGGEGR